MVNDDKIKKAIADKISKNLDHFKVCQGCESVVFYDSIFCPLCSGYRYDYNPANIKKAVQVLLERNKSLAMSLSELEEYL